MCSNLVIAGRIRDGGRLDDGLVDTFDQYPVTRWYAVQLDAVPTHNIDRHQCQSIYRTRKLFLNLS